MSRVRLLLSVVVALMILAAALPAAASYRFSIPSMRMTNTVRADASVEIEYEIQFDNHGQAIDVVDVGLPTEDYDFRNMTASIDGKPLTAIRRSAYIAVGVEVDLGRHAIPPGKEGTFRFRAVIPNMVYSDVTDDALASFMITPTWFDSNLLAGDTNLQIAVRLPPGVEPGQALDQGEAFTHKAAIGDTTMVGWELAHTRVDGPHMVGVSFPRSSMARVVVITLLDLFEQWFASSPGARLISGALVALLFGIFFFRYSGGTGWSIFFFLLAGSAVAYWAYPRLQLYTMPAWLVVGGLMEWRLRRRRSVYLPPLLHIEGGGIKRGLTAPEAAVLLELPLGKVVTLVIFGMLKKGLVRQIVTNPLRLEVAEEFRRKDRVTRRKAAGRLGAVIHGYEHAFLDLISAQIDVADTDFSDAMHSLVQQVAERVEGFDVTETKAYYQSIVSRAWIQARAMGELEMRTKEVDKNLEWLLIDDGWSASFETWDRTGYHYRPSWIRTSGSSPGSAAGAIAAAGGGEGGHSSPSFGDVAASFAGWTENVTGKLASAISPSSLQALSGEGGGAINLSGADKVTGDVLSAFFSGSGGGGGGGGGGCACAGCACACACAGGGR